MAETPTPANIPEGALISEEDFDRLNLTDEEIKGLAEGRVNPNFFRLPEGQEREKVQQELQKQAQTRLSWQAAQPRQKGNQVQFDDLPAEKQQEILTFLSQAREQSAAQPATPSEPKPQPQPEAQFQFDPQALFAPDQSAPAPSPETDPEPEQAEKDSVGDQSNPLCPHCLRDTQTSPFHPTDEDKKAFREACVDNRPFTKRYPLFGGALEVEFRTRPRWVSTRALAEVDEDRRSGDIPDNPPGLALAQTQERFQSLQMTASLRWMSGWKGPMPPLNDPMWSQKNLREIHDQLFNNIGEERWRAVLQSFLAFEGMISRMTEAATSENFWSGTGEAV